MNRKTFVSLVAALSILSALPAFAYNFLESCNGSTIRWQYSNITFNLLRSEFPAGSAQENAAEVARGGWNVNSPGNKWIITYAYWNSGVPGISGDGQNDIRFSSGWQYPGFAAVTQHKRTMCYFFPGAGSHYTEADILINPAEQFDYSAHPVPSDSMKSFASLLLHEHGHAMGLAHEDNVLATMNSGWPGPVGGPVGADNWVIPLGDDILGSRVLYGTTGMERDVAASAVRLVSPGVSRTIPAPASTNRNAPVSFQFTVLNRGTSDETIPVYFYLSPSRAVDPAQRFFVGSTTVSLQATRSTTGTVTLTIPTNAPTGYQYLSWVTDPSNGISEVNEANNSAALAQPTYVNANNTPNACFTASTTSGTAPLTVNVNAGCSYDPDGQSLSYAWDFGDGNYATGPTASNVYMPGDYVITLTVTDPNGASATATKAIRVACKPGSPMCEDPM